MRLAQDFNMRYPWSTARATSARVDGDPPAAYRYTEARLEPLAEEMMADLDKETVDFVPNFDETTEEPTVLPTPFPNLLVNGSTGIAVGMATNIPPHNMREVIDGVHRRDRAPPTPAVRRARLKALLKAIPGPTFRPAASSSAASGIFQAYTTGRGAITMRAQGRRRGAQEGRQDVIVVTEIPYQVNKKRPDREHRRAGAREEDRRHLATCATSPTATACGSSSS